MDIGHNVFYEEFANKLNSLENALIDIQENYDDKESVNEIFRSIHTVKGTADLLGMFEVVTLTHKAEDILELVRSDQFKFDYELVELFVEFKKYIALAVENVSKGIFNDPKMEALYIHFEKEFKKTVARASEESYNEDVEKNILIVDQSSIVRYTIKRILNELGHNVIMADNGIDGFKKLKENNIDLLFCDLSTPKISVESMLGKIRNDLDLQTLGIVLLVEYTTPRTQQIGKEMGARAWIGKPLDKEKLTIVLDKIL